MQYRAVSISGHDQMLYLVKPDPFDHIGEVFVDAFQKVGRQLKLHKLLRHLNVLHYSYRLTRLSLFEINRLLDQNH